MKRRDRPEGWYGDWYDYEAPIRPEGDHPAYGIPQFLDSTWAMYGGKPSDPAEQIRAGRDYIKRRYGGAETEGGYK